MTPERFQKVVSVLERRQPDLTVITDDVHKGQNLSAIVRTCDAVGVSEIYAAYSDGNYRAHTGTALGSQKWVEVNTCSDIGEPVKQLQEKGYQVVAAHLSDRAVDFRAIDYTLPTAVLFGAEKNGVSATSRQLVNQEVVIPMLGMVSSFNVSVACAVILCEAQRQRQVAGMYNRRRLSDDSFKRLLFEWCHPVIAGYCRAKKLPYPELDADGDLVNPSELKAL